jgi:hypothetical protein
VMLGVLDEAVGILGAKHLSGSKHHATSLTCNVMAGRVTVRLPVRTR